MSDNGLICSVKSAIINMEGQYGTQCYIGKA